MKTVTIPNLLWHGNEPREIFFPDEWDVEIFEAPGFGKPALGPDGIERAFDNPIGSPTIAELAVGAREVVVLFDDITRPTPIKEVLPWVLGPLEEARIPDSNIRFIPALGMHGAMHNIDFRKKLGDDVVRRYPIYNHNPYENCEDLGRSPSGIPVLINREFMSCDLKIGIGCITAHIHAGFGGGGKMILPGISGAETIKAFHGEVYERDPSSGGLGRYDGNVMIAEIEDVTRMSGLRVKVDALINARGEVTDLYVGDPVAEHRSGVQEAKVHYGSAMSPNKDIVVVNSYGKYNEMAICMMMGLSSVNFAKGTIVLIVDAPEGQACHYLMRSFGKEYGGEGYLKRGPLPETIKVIVCSEHPDATMCDLFAPNQCVTFAGDWDETLALLESEHPEGAAVGVVPDGTMQYFAGQ